MRAQADTSLSKEHEWASKIARGRKSTCSVGFVMPAF